MNDVRRAELMARRIRALSDGGYRFGQDLGELQLKHYAGRARGLLVTGVVGAGIVGLILIARRKKGR